MTDDYARQLSGYFVEHRVGRLVVHARLGAAVRRALASMYGFPI